MVANLQASVKPDVSKSSSDTNTDVEINEVHIDISSPPTDELDLYDSAPVHKAGSVTSSMVAYPTVHHIALLCTKQALSLVLLNHQIVVTRTQGMCMECGCTCYKICMLIVEGHLVTV